MSQARAPMGQARAPMGQAKAPMVQAKAPMSQPRAPMVQAKAPMSQPRAPMGQARAPMSQPRAPPEVALLFLPPRPNQRLSPSRLILSAYQKFFVRVRAVAARFRGPFVYLFPILFLMTNSAFVTLLLKHFSAERSRYLTQHCLFRRSPRFVLSSAS
jgi:hypothetical protein